VFSPNTLTEPVIAMTGLNHYFGSGNLRKQILFNLQIEIMPGEVVIMTGPSGSGKTTLLTLIGALRSAQEGSLRVLGNELRSASTNTLIRVRRQTGYIFQAHNLLNALTAHQNVLMSMQLHAKISAAAARHRATAILEAVGLGDHLHRYPNQLSGGQKQRVAIARALVSQPKLVLADEPTAALDKKSGRDVVELMRQLAQQQGCTILMVTHDNRILDIADRLIEMEDGYLSEASRAKLTEDSEGNNPSDSLLNMTPEQTNA
jgi:putative ABC transport system ATP-binding protein